MVSKVYQEYESRLLDAEAKEVNRRSLDDWVVLLHSIYRDNNKYRSGTYLWLQITSEAGQLAENIRRGHFTEALSENLVNLFGWLCGFVGKYLYEDEKTLKSDLISTLLRLENSGADTIPGPPSYSKWILHKYPGVCCACGNEFCICSAYRDTFERRKEGGSHSDHRSLVAEGYRLIREARKSYLRAEKLQKFNELSLDELIEKFISIYGGGHQDVDLWKIAAHFQEEVGEAAHEIVFLEELSAFERQAKEIKEPIRYQKIMEVAFRKEGSPRLFQEKEEKLKMRNSAEVVKYLRRNSADTLKEELADVFSWISAMLGKIGEDFREIREEPEKRYAFWKYLASRYYPAGSSICLACGQSPCQPSCRVVFFTRKIIRGEVKETNKTIEAHEQQIKKILQGIIPNRVKRIAREELRKLVQDNQFEAAITRAKQLKAEGLAESNDYALVMLSSIRETDWDDAWERLESDGHPSPFLCRTYAWMYWRLDRFDRAIYIAEYGLTEAIRRRSPKSEVLKLKNSLAYYYADAKLEGKAQQAFQYSKEAVKGRPGKYNPLDTLGYVYISFGKNREEILRGIELCESARRMPKAKFEYFAKHIAEAHNRLMKFP